MTTKLCRMATALQNTRIVKSAGPALQQNQALRHHVPNVPDGEVSKDMMGARSAAEYKLLIDLASAARGHSAHLRGHWACVLVSDSLANLRARMPAGVSRRGELAFPVPDMIEMWD